MDNSIIEVGIKKRLSEWLVNNNITGYQLNKKLNIARSTTDNWVKGLSLPSLSNFELLRTEYNIPFAWILTGISTSENPDTDELEYKALSAFKRVQDKNTAIRILNVLETTKKPE